MGQHLDFWRVCTHTRRMEMPKKVLIALPPAMLAEVDFIAEQEHRTRSDMIRESLRRYINKFKQQRVRPSEQSQSPLVLIDED
jgi:metal-responsive CopG/Arc/MetJ family transcriptional regulator